MLMRMASVGIEPKISLVRFIKLNTTEFSTPPLRLEEVAVTRLICLPKFYKTQMNLRNVCLASSLVDYIDFVPKCGKISADNEMRGDRKER